MSTPQGGWNFGWFGTVAIVTVVGSVLVLAAMDKLPVEMFSAGWTSTPTPTPSASPPLIPTPPLPKKVVSAEKSIADALAQLPNGEVYHNVPEKMQVGVSETIEAGIASKVTEEIKKRLQGRGDIDIESGVRFDPSGMEMELVARPDEFEVFKVKGGEQFVTASIPSKWIWRVKPLKAGDNLIAIKATVKLRVPALNIIRPVEVEVFSATRKVEVNLAYSINQFVVTNWKEVLGLVVGSGSLASLVTWWIGKKDKKKAESVEGQFYFV